MNLVRVTVLKTLLIKFEKIIYIKSGNRNI